MFYLFAFLVVNALPEPVLATSIAEPVHTTRMPVTSMPVTSTAEPVHATRMPVISMPVTPTTEMPPMPPPPGPTPDGYMWVTRKDTFWFRLDSVKGEIPLDTAILAMPVILKPDYVTDQPPAVQNLDVSVHYGSYGLWSSEAKIVYTYEYLHYGEYFRDDEVEDHCCGSSAAACDLRKRVEQYFHSTDFHAIKGIKLTGADIEWKYIYGYEDDFGHAHCDSPSSQKTSQTLGYIVGFTIAGFFLLVIAIICVWWYCKKRKAKATDAKNPLVSVDYAAGSWREAEEKC